MAMFGSSWDEDEYDDSPIGISSSMKEYVSRDDTTKQQSPSSEVEQRLYKAKVEIA